MIGRHAVAEHGQDPGVGDGNDRLGLRPHVDEIGRPPNIGRSAVPVEQIAFGGFERIPLRVALEDTAVAGAKHLRVHRSGYRVLNLLLRGPEVFQVNGLAFEVVADRIVD